MKRITTLLALCPAVDLSAAPTEWIAEGPRLTEVRDFLTAQAEAWDSRWPAAMEFTVDYDTTVSSMRWKGVLAGDRLDAVFVLNRLDGPAIMRGQNSEGLARWLKCSGKEWMEVAPHGSGDPSKPWSATISAECPTPFWNYSILSSVRQPITGVDLSRMLEEFPILRLRETAGAVEVDFAVSEPVEEAIRERRFDDIGGFVAVRARFEHDCAWRPVELLEIYRYPSGTDLGVRSSLATIDVAGMQGRIYRRRAWTDFFDTGGIVLPASYTMESWISPELDGEIVRRHYTEHHHLQATALADVPPDRTFASEPPPEAGPLGKISNTITGEVTIVDGRGLHERAESQDTFVLRSIRESTGTAAPAGPSAWRLGAYVCLFLSALLGGLLVARSTERRKVA